MSRLKQAFDFFIFTSFFIAFCAVLMVYQTAYVFGTHFPVVVYAFVFAGTICSYNFHWALTPSNPDEPSYKLKWNMANRELHKVLAVAGFAGAAITGFVLWQHWFWLGVTALLTFLYSAPKISHPFFIGLRKIAIGKTIFLAAAWAHITSLLPLLATTNVVEFHHVLYAVNRFFFLYAICILFDQRDVEKDRQAGIKSLITLLHPRDVHRLFLVAIATAVVTTFLLLFWVDVFTVMVLALPPIAVSLLSKKFRQSSSDYLYYFLLDGLMALSAPILILAKFAR